jgi:hypothetical protein
MTAPRLELHIDELVLLGFDPSDRVRIATAVERELAALLAGAPPSPALLAAGGAERLDGGSFRHDAGAPARQAGTHIAAAVHGAVQRGPSR